ncbi:flagellar basal-body rod protein FlgG [bacterium]|jgi:flagellar basal-body rod protein FlgG|nr:flagellar basal-body rod protein FlgG [bacterium]
MSLQALNTGATGMIGQSRNLDVIANNLANVGTDGFKKSRANFEDLLYKRVKAPGAGVVGAPDTPGVGIEYGVGTRVSATQLSFNPGTIRPTGRQLDIAINGPGFLQVDDGQGNFFYTRSGNLTLNSQGQIILATASRGYVVQPPVLIPQDALSISITADGQVAVTQPNVNQPQVIGQFNGVRFQNPEGLEQVGQNLFSETGASGVAEPGIFAQQGFGQIQQTFLEASNVEPVEELISLITSQRAYEINSQVIQTANENLRTVGTLRQ